MNTIHENDYEFEYWQNEFKNGFPDRDKLSDDNCFVTSKIGNVCKTMNFTDIPKMLKYVEYAVLYPIVCDVLNVECGEFAGEKEIETISNILKTGNITAAQDNLLTLIDDTDVLANISSQHNDGWVITLFNFLKRHFENDLKIIGRDDIGFSIYYGNNDFIEFEKQIPQNIIGELKNAFEKKDSKKFYELSVFSK